MVVTLNGAQAQESLPVRLHHSDPYVERLYELAMQQVHSHEARALFLCMYAA